MRNVLLVAVLVAVAAVTVIAEDKAEAKPEAAPAKHVLAIKGEEAKVCSCAADCKCTVKEGDETKCSCDKAVEKMSLKGKFVCEKCKVVVDKEGKCSGCQGDLKAVKAEEKKAE